MPFYEYQCSSCGYHHEALQKVTDKSLRKCPECGRSTLKRLMSAPVFRLKGGGWYETDFKSEKDGKRNLAGDQEPAESKADAQVESQKDSPTGGKKDDAKPAVEVKPDTKPAAASDKAVADKVSGSKPVATSSSAKQRPAKATGSRVKSRRR
jgi:putative FmdB family regulatory protein